MKSMLEMNMEAIEQEMAKKNSVYSKSYTKEEYNRMMFNSWANDAKAQHRAGWFELGNVCVDVANTYLPKVEKVVDLNTGLTLDVLVDSEDGPVINKLTISY